MLHAAVVPSLPATAATHCVSGVFTPHLHPDEREVVVVRQNILTLYRYDPHTVAAGDAPSSSSSLMRVVMETPLHAPPKGIAVCRPGGASVDVLVLLMDDFHLSFLQANPLLLQWDAVALVQLDDRPCMGEAAEVIDPIIRVDASKTQVAVLVRGSHLFFFRVLPKTKDGAVEVVAESSLSTTTAAGTVPQGGSADTPGVALDAWSDDEDEPNNNNNNSSNAPPAAEVGPTGSPTPAADCPPSAPITHDVLAMTSIAMLHLRSLEPRLRNVRDIAFVESTGEPLLAFLYEPQPVWAGHAKVVEWASKTVESRLLSCSIMWVKVALSAGGAADFLAIGDIHHLPFNTTHLVAVPAFHQVPSAVMGFGPNVCVHVSTKSVFGAYWNEAGHEEAKCAPNANNLYHPMTWMDPAQERSQELIRTNLDLANCTVVPLTTTSHAVELSFLVFTEEAGTVLELVVSADEYKVSTMRARIVMADCFCSCWAAVGADAFFLGSSRDDSRLVVYDRRAPSLTVRQSFWGLGPIQDMDVVDGTSDVKELCGRFVNEDVEQSPYAALYQSVVLEPAPLMTTAKKREVMDVALCTGLHSAGALSVLRHSIRDKVLRKESVNATSVFYIPSSSTATDGADQQQQQQQQQQRKRGREDRRGGGRDDSHLLLTGRNFSLWFLVRRAGLQQVKTFALDMNARTILATSLGWASAVLQVTGTELRLVSVDGKQKLHTLALEPFLGEETAGSDGEKTQVSAAILLPSMQSLILRSTNGKLLECSLKDVKDPNLSCKVIATDVVAVAAWEARQRLVVMQTHQLVFLDATSDGAWRSVARFPCFDALPPFALDGIEAVSAGGTKTRASSRNPAITITHMAVHPSSSPNAVVEAVLVVVTSSGELQTYNFHPKDVHGPQRLLKDLHHLLDVRADNDAIESIEAKKQRLLEEKARLAEEADQARNTSARLAAFHDLNGHDGIYACGQHPIFLMEEADSGRLALHHHKVADAVRGFSPFPSMELPHGYMYCSEGAVHVATMQTFGSSIGHGWWMKRVPLHATPHHVVYHPAAQACCVVTSHPAPFSPKKAPFDVQMKVYVDEEGKKHSSIVSAVALPPIPSNAGLPVPLNDRFQLRLLSCSDWSCADVLELQENERVLMAQCVEIDRQTALDASAAPTRAPIFAIATAFPLGEDVISRGRILLVAVQHRPSDGKAHFTMLHAENTQGPVTALCAMEGHIAVAVGGTIRVLHYDTIKSQLTTVSMLYAGAYVSRLTAFREYLIVGDLYHSATMVRFSATNHTLTVLGKDYNNFSIVEASMLFQDRAFGIITTDSDRNLCVLGYTPKVFGAEGGSAKKPAKVMQAQFSVDAEFRSPGGSVVKMLRLPSLSPSSSLGLYCTNYGEVGYLVPVSEQSNKTAQWVATRVEMDAAHVGGLAPSLFLGLSQTDARHAIRAKERLIYTPLLDVLLRMDLPMRSTTAARALTQLDRVARIRSSILEECRAVL